MGLKGLTHTHGNFMHKNQEPILWAHESQGCTTTGYYPYVCSNSGDHLEQITLLWLQVLISKQVGTLNFQPLESNAKG